MIPIKVVTIHDEHPDLSRRELHEVMRASMAQMGVKWAVDLLPEHFGPAAAGKFGYARRTLKWRRRKDRDKAAGRAIGGGDDDLIYRGTLREMVLTSARNLVRAYPKRCTITMVGPVYFTLRPRSKHTIRLANEVLSMSGSHRRQLSDAADRGFERKLASIRASRRLRKASGA